MYAVKLSVAILGGIGLSMATPASAIKAFPQHASNCTWTTQNNSAIAECLEFHPQGSYCNTNCCKHYHYALNWNVCVMLGDQKKVGSTPKYFQSRSDSCEDTVCTEGEAGQDTHFKNDCSVEPC